VILISKPQDFDEEKLGLYSKKLLSYFPKGAKKVDKSKYDELRILRVICQRPYFTGSGINHVNLLQKGKELGIKQCSVFGNPANEPNPLKKIIDLSNTFPVIFKNRKKPEIKSDIPFPVAGMSDEMPYDSTKFSSFNENMLELYLEKFAEKITSAVIQFHPNIIHSHHLWLVTSLCKVLFPDIPLVATCHNTALRQMELSPQLKDFVEKPIQSSDAIAIIDEDQQKRVKKIYNFEEASIKSTQFFLIGQGINTNIFSLPPAKTKEIDSKTPINLIYVGKLSYSKGVPQLIKAFKEVAEEIEQPIHLSIVGSGQGPQKEDITSLGKEYGDIISFLGQLEQQQLAEYFRKSDLFVLPSFYDGFPKVLLEALSSGCRAIITDLPGIKQTLFKKCGANETVQFLPMPKMKSIDEPFPEEIPEFVEKLKDLIKKQISLLKVQKTDLKYARKIKGAFGWEALFQAYLTKYKELLGK